MTPRRRVGWSSLLLVPLNYGDALLRWANSCLQENMINDSFSENLNSLSTVEISLLDLLHGYLDDGSDDETLESGSDVSHSWSCSPTPQAILRLSLLPTIEGLSIRYWRFISVNIL